MALRSNTRICKAEWGPAHEEFNRSEKKHGAQKWGTQNGVVCYVSISDARDMDARLLNRG